MLSPLHLGWLWEGFLVTIALSGVVVIIALPLGFLLCIARQSGLGPLSHATALWLSIFRNTPLLVQLFFWYFGVSAFLPEPWMVWFNARHPLGFTFLGLTWPPFEVVAGAIGLIFYTAAFMAEEFRAGVLGVPKGQYLAARALGLGGLQTWRHIVLPQAIRNAFSPLLGQVMNCIKNSSLAMAIGVAELSYTARKVETETFRAFEAFGIATLLYILLIALLAWAGALAERRIALPGRAAEAA